jgi:hypothetical protein
VAVAKLLGLDTMPPPVYKGQFKPGILFKTFKALHAMGR